RIRNHSETVVACPYALFEEFRFLRQCHWPQLDVRDSGAAAGPDTIMLVRQQLLHDIIRQVTLTGEVLAAVALRSSEIHAHESLRRSEPNRAISGSGYCRDAAHGQRTRIRAQIRRNTGVNEAVKCAKFLRIRR